MKKSSRIALAAVAVLIAYACLVFVPLVNNSKPNFTDQDAENTLSRLSDAFRHTSPGQVTSFASPDAIIAGRDLEKIHKYLQKGFSYVKNLSVTFRDLKVTRSGEEVSVAANVVAGELPPGSKEITESYYNHPVMFHFERRDTKHLFGLFHTYDWKIVKVDAEGMPDVGI